ncbi:MAG: hypothetical protein JST90_08300 [Bacteroidetes bacterium]|nr:hypothetical protein [Bacteroidota bacterium]
MHRLRVLLTFAILLSLYNQSFAQNDSLLIARIERSEFMKKRARTTNNAVLISISYSALIPVGELKQRFGFCNSVALNLSYKMNHNWLLGVEGAYLFGSRVKENQILAPVSTSTGQFIQATGDLGDINLEMSGFELALRTGKIFKLSDKHPNSGILLTLAPGFIQHKIWIRATKDSYKQFDTDYKTGYDRLTNGFMLQGQLGYLYLERKKYLNFYGGIEYTLGITQNRRAWNFFDSTGGIGGPDSHTRLDMFIGFKVGWIIPVFINKDTEEYYR